MSSRTFETVIDLGDANQRLASVEYKTIGRSVGFISTVTVDGIDITAWLTESAIDALMDSARADLAESNSVAEEAYWDERRERRLHA